VALWSKAAAVVSAVMWIFVLGTCAAWLVIGNPWVWAPLALVVLVGAR
jgi:hypothetical protein